MQNFEQQQNLQALEDENAVASQRTIILVFYPSSFLRKEIPKLHICMDCSIDSLYCQFFAELPDRSSGPTSLPLLPLSAKDEDSKNKEEHKKLLNGDSTYTVDLL